MSVEVAAEQAPFVSDFIPGAIGDVVVAVGHGRSGEDAFAVWLLGAAQLAMPGAWDKTMVRLPDLLVEVSDERRNHAEAVVEHQAASSTKSRLAPLARRSGHLGSVSSILPN